MTSILPFPTPGTFVITDRASRMAPVDAAEFLLGFAGMDLPCVRDDVVSVLTGIIKIGRVRQDLDGISIRAPLAMRDAVSLIDDIRDMPAKAAARYLFHAHTLTTAAGREALTGAFAAHLSELRRDAVAVPA